MFLLEYTYWKIAAHLVNSGYGVIQAGESDEIWLEGSDKSSHDLVRLYKHDLDFRQEMVRDIEEQAERVERVRHQLGRRRMKLLNVFFSTEAPVDDWEEIAKKLLRRELCQLSRQSLEERCFEMIFKRFFHHFVQKIVQRNTFRLKTRKWRENASFR